MKPVFLFISLLFSLNASLFANGLSGIGNPSATVLSFTATEFKGLVKIQWSTSFEQDIKEYYVYRSVDKQNWFVVGVYPPKSGSLIKNYDFIDQTANGGVNYYKLEAVDSEEHRTELKQTEIEMEDKQKAVNVYWETELTRIKLISGEQIYTIELELSDMIGRKYPVNFIRDNTHEITIITGQLDRGSYFLTCRLNGTRTVRRKAIF